MLNTRTIILSAVLVLTLIFGFSSALAASVSSNIKPFDVCNSPTVSHPLGVEGGLLSLLDGERNTNPNPVLEILRDESYSVRIAYIGQAAQIAYTKNTC